MAPDGVTVLRRAEARALYRASDYYRRDWSVAAGEYNATLQRLHNSSATSALPSDRPTDVPSVSEATSARSMSHVAIILASRSGGGGAAAMRASRYPSAAGGLIRSFVINYRSPLHLHLVSDAPSCRAGAAIAAASATAPLRTSCYDVARCVGLTRPLAPFTAMHFSSVCKLFLAQLLLGIKGSVLVLDLDTVVTQDPQPCLAPLPAPAYIGAVFDMGAMCGPFPSRCWPLAYEFAGARCREGAGGAPLNGGVLLLHLGRMRAARFAARIVAATRRTAAMLPASHRQAEWGDQEFLNNWLRLHPESLHHLPCGCNFQPLGYKAADLCGGQPLFIAHLWHVGMLSPHKATANLATHTSDPARLCPGCRSAKLATAALGGRSGCPLPTSRREGSRGRGAVGARRRSSEWRASARRGFGHGLGRAPPHAGRSERVRVPGRAAARSRPLASLPHTALELQRAAGGRRRRRLATHAGQKPSSSVGVAPPFEARGRPSWGRGSG